MTKTTGNNLFNAVLLCIALFITTGITHAQNIRLIVDGDDMGMTHGTLVAFERASR